MSATFIGPGVAQRAAYLASEQLVKELIDARLHVYYMMAEATTKVHQGWPIA